VCLACSPLRGSQTAKLSFNKIVFAVQFLFTVFFELSFIMAAAVTSQTCETKLKKSKGMQATQWRASFTLVEIRVHFC
jgi:hypothetical protein